MTDHMTAAPEIPGVDAPGGSRCDQSTRKEQKGKTIMTESTDDRTPDVPLPIGAVPPDDVVKGWADFDNEFRVVYGQEYVFHTEARPDAELWVQACATQMADGTIQPRDPNLLHIQSGPTVSVQCHWENYLTADEARAIARSIEQSADVVERWADPGRHVCEFDWCDVNSRNEGEHWWLEYTTASLRSGDPYHLTSDHVPHKVGIGVAYDEGEIPCVVVHIDGGQRDDDVDAHLKISEAVALRDLLDHGISSAKSALRHMCETTLDGTK